MKKQKFLILLEKYEKGICTEQEEAIVDDFYNTFNKQASRWDNWDISTKEKIRLEIHTRIRQKIAVSPSTGKIRSLIAWKIAASIIILLCFGYFTYHTLNTTQDVQYLTQTTEKGQKATITLSDGTVVQLNSKSSITFPVKFSKLTRTITLTGEAFFKVNKDPDKPFIVTSGNLETTVLGTSFNIRVYPEDPTIEVTVASGRVKVESIMDHSQKKSSKNSSLSILTQNQQAIFNKISHTLEKRDIDLHQYLAWKEGVIILNNTTVYEASKILERWYNVEFEFANEDIKHYIINGEFRSDKLVNLLENIKFLTGIEYQAKSNNRIILSRQSNN